MTKCVHKYKPTCSSHFVGHLVYYLSNIFKLGGEFDGSNSYMKFGRNSMKNDQVRLTTTERTYGQASQKTIELDEHKLAGP